MKFNTLTFDANLPTVQQVNVPTNTDYKVGMKVKRNGEIQQLGPDEFTIYTGEITPGDTTVVGPADSPSNLERTVNGTNKTTIFMMFPKASLSAYANKYIAPSDIEQTWHLSGETTATPLNYGDLEIGYGVQYVEGSTVWYSYQGKWCRIAGGAIAEKKDRVQIIDTALMRQNFNLQTAVAEVFFNGTIPTAQAPILVDSTITFHDEDTPVTIPTDAEKTNGYVTFTQASNDDPSFRQLKVAIEHGYNYNDTYTVKGQFPASTPNPNPSILAIKASELGLAGVEIHASDYGRLSARYWRKNTPQPADLSAWTDVNLWTGQVTGIEKLELTSTDGTNYCSVYHPLIDYTISEIDQAVPSLMGFTFKAGEYYFVEREKTGDVWPITNITQKKIFGADDTMLYTGGLRFTANYYWGRSVSMAFGTPFKSNFKLNINEFKSQCGDLNVQTDPEFNTAKVEGTYADGTEFSFDFCIE